MYRVLAYPDTRNLGDAVLTLALTRLLDGPVRGVYRDEMFRSAGRDTLVLNGFMRGTPNEMDHNVVVAGLFLDPDIERYLMIPWLRPLKKTIGARDPHTAERMRQAGIPVEMVGCVTSTLPRYTGRRQGTLVIDADSPEGDHETGTMKIHPRLPWGRQWQFAVLMLERLAKAELVITSRLHVAIPCLAMGTPVMMSRADREGVAYPERLTILDHYGFEYDRPNVIDMTPHADAYRKFLSDQLGAPLADREPVFPKP